MTTHEERPSLLPNSDPASDRPVDVFISHASEDKAVVARQLADVLIREGWTVWLDELELTIGDSLSRQIDAALARSRFGVVILSPAFFAKEWPQRELAGLASRELATGSKVILPVWHNVDHNYIAERSPLLADRLGVSTSIGIEKVAFEVSRVLTGPGSIDQSLRTVDEKAPDSNQSELLFSIPVSTREQADLIRDQSDWWEYRLYAGALMQGRIELEGKWLDHELRLPGGARKVASEPISDFLTRENAEMQRFLEILNRVFDADTLERAFGAPGVPGDSQRIIHVARGVVQVYESMMDWAAELRNTRVQSEYAEIVELMARMADGPVRQIREFIQLVGDQIARIPVQLAEAASEGATIESPKRFELTLHVELDPENQERLYAALDRLG